MHLEYLAVLLEKMLSDMHISSTTTNTASITTTTARHLQTLTPLTDTPSTAASRVSTRTPCSFQVVDHIENRPNTYHTAPMRVFSTLKVQDVLRDVIESMFAGKAYDADCARSDAMSAANRIKV